MTNKEIYQCAPKYYHYYFDLVETNDLLSELKKTTLLTEKIFALITPEKENFSYAANKWTTKEVLKHIIDCERIFAYRALRFSRFDNTELAGFDENKYIDNIKTAEQNLLDLQDEYLTVRKSTILLFKNMTNEMLDFKGIANKSSLTARTIGFMIIGHNLHHNNFIQSTYLS
ncbi:MAG: DinB family protein [Chitinophagaceae bacterium]|nr:DinB family protein [Chitinophagaceae bacterium]MCW5904653.1 DinB family protein [Chitinophagaceae bacterium]